MKRDIFWSAAVYLTAATLPYRIFSYYPVRDRLRVPVWLAAALIGVSEVLEAALFGFSVAGGGTGREVEFIFVPMCLLIYLFCVRADVSRLLFLYLFIMDYLMIGKGSALFVEARLFFSPDMSFSTPRSIFIHLLVFAVTVPFMYLFFKRTKERVFRTEAPQLWRTIWLVPALTTFVALHERSAPGDRSVLPVPSGAGGRAGVYLYRILCPPAIAGHHTRQGGGRGKGQTAGTTALPST